MKSSELFIRDIKESVVPIHWGKNAVNYSLSVAQVDAIKNEAGGDIQYMMQLFFDAGFKAGRTFQKKEGTAAETLIRLRGNRTIEEVAAACNMTPAALQGYENGSVPRDEIKLRLANYYGYDVVSLYC